MTAQKSETVKGEHLALVQLDRLLRRAIPIRHVDKADVAVVVSDLDAVGLFDSVTDIVEVVHWSTSGAKVLLNLIGDEVKLRSERAA